MTRRLFAVLLVVVVGGGVAWFLIRDDPSTSSVDVNDRGRASVQGPEQGPSESGVPLVRKEVATSRYEEADADVPEDGGPAFEEPPPDGRRILVVDKASGEPVPGAMVLMLDWESLTWEEAGGLQRMGDMAETLLRHGKRYQADDDGFARVPEARNAVVAASQGDLWGFRDLWGFNTTSREGQGPLRVEIAPVKAVRVVVVDGAGRPVAGVPVVVGFSGYAILERRTDDLGGAAFKSLDQLMGNYSGLQRASWVVAFGLPLKDGPSVEVDPWAPPPEPIRLVLPDTGRVVVTAVDGQGEPLESGFVQLGVRGPDKTDPRWMGSLEGRLVGDGGTFLEDGRAVFPFVGLDLALIATVFKDEVTEPAHARARGPGGAGAEVVLHVTVDQPHPTIVGRVVDAEGTPIRDVRFNVEIIEGGRPQWGAVPFGMTSDGDGLFRLPLSKPWEEGLPRVVVVKKMNGLNVEGEGRIDAARHFPRGETAVGDIRIAPAPLLASGVVVDDQGHPLSRAVVEVHRRRHVDSNGEFDSWVFLDPSGRFESKSDDEGRFEVRGFVEPPGDLSITARAAGYLPAEPLPFTSGASGIRLALLRAGSIQGRLLLDPRVPVHQLRVWVTELSGETESAHAASILENGMFELEGVLPGIVRVDVVSGETGIRGGSDAEPKRPLATVDGVRVVGGEKTSDPRLTIDLRGRLHTIRVHVRVPDGIEDAGILLQVIDGRGAFIMSYLDDGRASLLTDALPLGLTVVSQGCRSETRSGVTEDVEITLRQGIPVHVQVTLEGSLSAPKESVRAHLVPGADAAGFSFDAAGFSLSGHWLVCDAAGIARLIAGSPGSHTIKITLEVESESGSSAVELGRETRIDVMDTTGPQTFHVRITAAELDQARFLLETIGFPR